MCARCRAHLVLDAHAVSGPDVVVGVEAHIVSASAGGPRHRSMTGDKYDAYDNIILLCPTDHAVIDADVIAFPESTLLELKRAHEMFVSARLRPRPEVRVRRSGKPTVLRLMSSGTDLLNLAGGSEAGQNSHPEPRTKAEADLIASFLDTVFEYCELWEEIGPGQRVTAGYEVTLQLDELRDSGLVVYAGIESGVIEGGMLEQSSPWQTSVIQIRRADDPEILRTSTQE